ncbi:MAG: pyruvate/2-oxoglutarate dehydrogenase complex dihydrolipoamide dehydrogenase (E3) component [Patescibacteria group bacterium]|jgi:pyruvate/2-oxoglutarate dehydrogenase complex dihydrolipoamide dehydrogenase (E3) component
MEESEGTNFDLIVIGAGAGGLNIASFMTKVGFKVLLVDRTDENIGGECLNTGCVPSKALIHVAKVVHDAKAAKQFNLRVMGDVHFPTVMKYVNDKVETIRVHENADYFIKMGMHVALGIARFIGRRSIMVNGSIYTGKKIIVATGSRARMLDVPGMPTADYVTNDNLFSLKDQPRHLLIVGGGPIGLEMAQAFRRLGSKVTVLIRGEKFLPKESSVVTDILLKELDAEGVRIVFNAHIDSFPDPNTALVIQKEKRTKVRFDKVLISIGRDLNFKGLDLEKAGVAVTEDGIIRDDYLRTTNKDILLAGDIVGAKMFTHSAELHASVIIHNFFAPFFIRKKKFNEDKMSWVTFTDPEIATFGLNEEQLLDRGVKFIKMSLDFTHDDRAIVDEATNGNVVIYVSKGRIVGGSMVGKNAGELSQELIFAMANDMPLKSFLKKTHAYPTASRINKAIVGRYLIGGIGSFSKRMMHLMY